MKSERKAPDATQPTRKTNAKREFARLFACHLDKGTRPPPASDVEWGTPEFLTSLEKLVRKHAPAAKGPLAAPKLRAVQGWRADESLPQPKFLPLILETLFGEDWRQSPHAIELERQHKLASYAERRAIVEPEAREEDTDDRPAPVPSAAGWVAELGHHTRRLVEMIVHTPPLPNDPDTAWLNVSVSLGEETVEVDGCLLKFRLEEPYIVADYVRCEPEAGTRLGEQTQSPTTPGASIEAPSLTGAGIVFEGGAWKIPPFDPDKPGSNAPLVGANLALIRATGGDGPHVTLGLWSGGRNLNVEVLEGKKPLDALRRKLIKIYLQKHPPDPGPLPGPWARSTLRKRTP